MISLEPAALATLCVEAAQDLALGLTYRIRHERLSLAEHCAMRRRIDGLHQLARLLQDPLNPLYEWRPPA